MRKSEGPYAANIERMLAQPPAVLRISKRRPEVRELTERLEEVQDEWGKRWSDPILLLLRIRELMDERADEERKHLSH